MGDANGTCISRPLLLTTMLPLTWSRWEPTSPNYLNQRTTSQGAQLHTRWNCTNHVTLSQESGLFDEQMTPPPPPPPASAQPMPTHTGRPGIVPHFRGKRSEGQRDANCMSARLCGLPQTHNANPTLLISNRYLVSLVTMGLHAPKSYAYFALALTASWRPAIRTFMVLAVEKVTVPITKSAIET